MLDDPLIQVLHGGQYDIASKYIAPTVVRARLGAKCLQSEIFGPILPVIVLPDVCSKQNGHRAPDASQVKSAIDYVNQNEKPLALYIFSDDSDEQKTVCSAVSLVSLRHVGPDSCCHVVWRRVHQRLHFPRREPRVWWPSLCCTCHRPPGCRLAVSARAAWARTTASGALTRSAT